MFLSLCHDEKKKMPKLIVLKGAPLPFAVELAAIDLIFIHVT